MVRFEVRPSSIPGAGDGLWSLETVPFGTLLPLPNLVAALTSEPPSDDCYVLDGFVRPTQDMTSLCVCDGVVTTFDRIVVTREMRRPLYFHAPHDEPLMKANDFGWSERVRSEAEYDRCAARNQVELIMVLVGGRVCGVCGYARRRISAGAEVGITYGHQFWSE